MFLCVNRGHINWYNLLEVNLLVCIKNLKKRCTYDSILEIHPKEMIKEGFH